MRSLPVADPGVPDQRSATRFLLWLAARIWPTLAGGMALGVVSYVGQALIPAVLGRAIDAGLIARDLDALTRWALLLFGLGMFHGILNVVRHRFASFNWLAGAYRTIQLTVDAANRLGATLPRRLATGEVVSIGTADINHIGGALDILSRGTGAIFAVVTITTILLVTSVPLGLVVVLGVPLLMAVVGVLIRPLHKRQEAYRDQQATLTTQASDIVAGLRVLRGVGGESVFSARYRAESQALRHEGVRVARVEALLEAAQILMPGIFLVLVTWLGARFALRGEITVGQIVSFYGYTVFLIGPLRTLTELIDHLTRGHVSARRVVSMLDLRPEITDPGYPVEPPAGPGELVDVDSGLTVRPGRLTALVAVVPEDAVALADRLARYVDSGATLCGVPLRELALATVRRRIMVSDNDARIFSGPLRAELDPHDRADAATIEAALVAASATDIVAGLPDGLAGRVAERGREFSGGQQQRLRLVRALVADPETLILIEPTSAVDAHTEARIAARLGPARRGRTTLVCTTSPLVLDRADHVVFVSGGKVVAEGGHRELLDTVPRYAALVTRAEEADPGERVERDDDEVSECVERDDDEVSECVERDDDEASERVGVTTT